MVPLYSVVLKAVGRCYGLRLLDLGCASGVFCHCAARMEMEVAGTDLCTRFANAAAMRVPRGIFVDCPMEDTLMPAESFDLVTCLNTLYYSESPVDVAREAHRLLRPGGKFVISTLGHTDDCDVSRVVTQFYTQSVAHPADWHSPFAFSRDGMLHSLLKKTGFTCSLRAEAELLWNYPDEASALQGLTACEQGQRAVEHVGEKTVHEKLRETLHPFRLPRGGYRLRNRFKYLVAQKS